MIATLEPRNYKYCGTKITVIDDNGREAQIEICDTDDLTPSKRELEANGYTEQQWEENTLVNCGLGGKKIPIREMDIACDNHYESKQAYELALKIVDKLNSI
jgi:hypothetical protein